MVLLLYGMFSCFTSVGRNNIEQRRRLAEACRPASEIIAGVAQDANLSANAKIIADLAWPVQIPHSMLVLCQHPRTASCTQRPGRTEKNAASFGKRHNMSQIEITTSDKRHRYVYP